MIKTMIKHTCVECGGQAIFFIPPHLLPQRRSRSQRDKSLAWQPGSLSLSAKLHVNSSKPKFQRPVLVDVVHRVYISLQVHQCSELRKSGSLCISKDHLLKLCDQGLQITSGHSRVHPCCSSQSAQTQASHQKHGTTTWEKSMFSLCLQHGRLKHLDVSHLLIWEQYLVSKLNHC